MPYRKHIWVNGEIIKADLLNNIENGIYNEEQRAMTAESTLDGKITTNKTLADNAIGSEETRARNAEAALTQSIENEEIRATSSEGTLSAQITSETSRATAAEESLRSYVDEKVSTAYKAGGSVFFADLPALAASRLGFVYNVKDAFTTTASFLEGAGKDYPAGSNVGIVEKDEESYEAATVESTDNPAEMGLYELSGTDYIPTEDTAPVSGKTYYELVAVPTYYYDVLAGFVDTSDFITDTDYATAQAAGIVKPDGTTITVDANGVISSQGGGDVSSEEMADVVNILGAKNLIPPKTGEMQVEIDDNTVTFSEDGSAYISGQWGSGQPTYTYTYNMLPKGRYTISINNEDVWGVWLYAEVNGNVVAHSDTDSSFTLNSEQNVSFGIGFDEQHAGDSKRIWPTCIPCHIKDQNFVTYAKTNRQLTEDANAIEPIVNVYGSKNLLCNEGPDDETTLSEALTFHKNSDGSITVNGNLDDQQPGNYYYSEHFKVPRTGNYILSKAGDDAEDEFGNIRFENKISGRNNNYLASATKEDVTIYLEKDAEYLVRINFYEDSTVTFNNRIFYPMIRDAGVKDSSFVPYAKTNRQLTETVLTQTLTAGSTSLTFTNDRITDNCLIKIAPKRWVPPTSASQSGNTVTVTFPEQAADLDVAVLIREL